MRVTDFIADYIFNLGIKHVFMVSGGGMMFLSDGIAMHSELEAVCVHHEQAAAMAAVSYAKYNQHFGVCYITTGCGGTNAITGLLNAWQDNIPCIFISGQAKRKETVRNSGLKLRQFGVQEADIISVVRPLTKYSIMVNKPELIGYYLSKAIFLAKTGRPGPVWIDVPSDVQGAQIDFENLLYYSPEEKTKHETGIPTSQDIDEVTSLIEKAERPIIIAGQGIRLGNAISEFKGCIEKFKIPFVVSKLAIDLLPSEHPLFIGRIGNKGDRPGNMSVQNSDLVVSIGCRLSVSSTGHEYETFCREATVVVVDIDPVEHKKNTVKIDKFIHADAKKFLYELIQNDISKNNPDWLEKCSHWKNSYPVCLPEYQDVKDGINLYYFIKSLSSVLKKESVVVSDAGSSFYVTTQGLWLKEGQRSIASGGQAEMGYTVPATVGVCYAKNKGEVIGITGDGSFQMNIQELQTIVHNNLPIKIFVWNNDGYLSIRASQRKFFDGRFIGTDSTSGLSFPDIEKIANAYGIKYVKLENSANLSEQIGIIINEPKAVLCEVMCIRDQEIVPSVMAMRKDDGTMVSKPIEDMYPFLDRKIFLEEMIVAPLKSSTDL